jgi:hypothetical protein
MFFLQNQEPWLKEFQQHILHRLYKEHISSNAEVYVWANARGSHQGQAIVPLYKSLPQITQEDKLFYELLTIAGSNILRILLVGIWCIESGKECVKYQPSFIIHNS